jgi:hypothetical protein
VVLGLSSEEEAVPIEEHVEHCPDCAESLNSMREKDPLVGLLRRSGALADERPQGAVVERLLRNLRALRPPESTSGTVAGDPGESLDDRMRRPEALSIAETLRIGREIATALDALHSRQLVHGELQPANVFLEAGTGRVKLLGFEAEPHPAQPAAGCLPHYTAPEKIAARIVDARADLFSLGCILYRLTTSRVPFVGANAWAILHAQHFEAPRTPRSLNADVPPALAQLILRLLDKDPVLRPASAREVIQVIAAIE